MSSFSVSSRSFFSKHKIKLLYTFGVVGGGYALYQLYQAQRKRILASEQEKEAQLQADELVESRLKAHFESLQNISETTSLASSLQSLKLVLFKELNHTDLTKRLRDSSLTPVEKLRIWEKLKILSFTRLSAAIWSLTMLNLYIRAQVNILGRYIFIVQAQGFENLDEMDQSIVLCQQKFLASADYLLQHGVLGLIYQMEAVVKGVLEIKNLKEPLTFKDLSEILEKILKVFSSNSRHWLNSVLPETGFYRDFSASTSVFGASQASSAARSTLEIERVKLEQLMAEIQSALSSNDFATVLEQSLMAVSENVMEEMYKTFQSNNTTSVPLARLLAPIAHASTQILENTSDNKFINVIGNVPAVRSFFALVYSNTGEFE